MRKKLLSLFGISSLTLPLLIIFLIAIVLISCLGAAVGANQSQTTKYTGGGSVSSAVLAYQPTVSKFCTQYEIPDYVSLVLAVMQQESGGEGTDPMQCSESPYNLDYPNLPGGIADPNYSIEVGVQYLAGCLKAADCQSPDDITGISLALQGYNFGGGYIPWALDQGGYTQANAVAFSDMKAQQMGWSGYGDTEYVDHVLRYYSVISSADDGYINYPLAAGTFSISGGYGYRDGKLHKGIDLAAPEGTNIYAAATGTIVFSDYGSVSNGYGGYGNVVVIKHNGTFSTLYAHCSQLLVTAGTTVKNGDIIALVGDTGDSDGNHCHLEVRVNGTAADPIPYLDKTESIEVSDESQP